MEQRRRYYCAIPALLGEALSFAICACVVNGSPLIAILPLFALPFLARLRRLCGGGSG